MGLVYSRKTKAMSQVHPTGFLPLIPRLYSADQVIGGAAYDNQFARIFLQYHPMDHMDY